MGRGPNDVVDAVGGENVDGVDRGRGMIGSGVVGQVG